MSSSDLRTFIYAPPRTPGAAVPSLPVKAPHTRRTYVLQIASLLRLLGQPAIVGAAVVEDAPLVLGPVSYAADSVTLMLGGGVVGQPAARVTVALLFADGGREDLVLAQPVAPASPDIPDSAATVGNQVITVAYQPLEIGDMPLLPGGPQPTDFTLVIRPGANGGPDVPGRMQLLQLGAGSGGTVTYRRTGATVSGHRALMVTAAGRVVHADPSDPAAYNFAGLSIQAGDADTDVAVALSGDTVAEPSWSWTPGRAVLVGPAGTLTQVPPVTGTLHQIGVAQEATTLTVQPFSPIRLS